MNLNADGRHRSLMRKIQTFQILTILIRLRDTTILPFVTLTPVPQLPKARLTLTARSPPTPLLTYL
jgi:hypothetical protein